jgi:hypothetical protein
VLAPLHHDWFAPLQKHPGKTTPDGQHVASLVLATGAGTPAVAHVDVIGIGSSVFDQLNDFRPETGSSLMPALGINFGAPTKMTDRTHKLPMANIRAAAYWRLREALDPAGHPTLMLPPDRELLADLTAPRWQLRTGKVYIESKEEIKERIGRSPDCGDAVALGYFSPTFAAEDWIGAYDERIEQREEAESSQVPLVSHGPVLTRKRLTGQWDRARQL